MKKKNCTIRVAKTKALISAAVTAPLLLHRLKSGVLLTWLIWKCLPCPLCFRTHKTNMANSHNNEPPRGKTNNVVSEQVRHKPTCTSTEAG